MEKHKFVSPTAFVSIVLESSWDRLSISILCDAIPLIVAEVVGFVYRFECF